MCRPHIIPKETGWMIVHLYLWTNVLESGIRLAGPGSQRALYLELLLLLYCQHVQFTASYTGIIAKKYSRRCKQ